MKRVIVLATMFLACDAAPDPSKYPPPLVSCSDDAGCAPPPSGCADQHWMYYYDDGQCEQNQCKWITKFFECYSGDDCSYGRCYYNRETALGPYGP